MRFAGWQPNRSALDPTARASCSTKTAGRLRASDGGSAWYRRLTTDVSVPAAPELARHLADILGAAGVPYGIGGALALGVWGFPRATNDVDLDVFVAPDALEPVFAVLRAGACEFDAAEWGRSAARRPPSR